MNGAFLTSYHTLCKVYNDKAFSSIELNKSLTFAKASDKALITKIVYGVLDKDIFLDYLLSSYVKKSKPDVKVLLKIGAYCLKFLSIPPYAVVNDLVEISKIFNDKYLVGFVNASLKNIAKDVANGKEIALPVDEIERLSVKYSYPLWALKKLIKDYGKQTAEKIVSTVLAESTNVRVNTDKISSEDFAKLLNTNGVSFLPTVFPDAYAVSGSLACISDELFTVQSLSSMYVSHIASYFCGDFLDCCSAPGGKAVYITQLAKCNTVACDVYEHRCSLIEKYAKRMGVSLNVCLQDATVFNPDFDGKFDCVLCDVPCSGFGVLDSRPDIKLFRQNIDISTLSKLQAEILENSSRYVKSGGILVYSTCTLFDNENGQNVRRFLAKHGDFEPSEIKLNIPCGANGKTEYQFLPHVDGCQAFYCAKLKRK